MAAIVSKFRLGIVLISVLSLPGVASMAASQRQAKSYIVVLDTVRSQVGSVAEQHAEKYGLKVGFIYRHALRGYSARIPRDKVDEVRSDPEVASVSKNRKVNATAQTLPTGVNRVDGELSSTISGNGSGSVNVDVAVIDTGIDVDHPDLNVVGGKNCSTGGTYDDGSGHGTHVAGIIAAKDDLNGVVGVAPGARLWAVRVLDKSGAGTEANILCGIDWVTANASTIEVANMSLGSNGTEPSGEGCATGVALHDAICNSVAAGVTYVVAAGNSSANARRHVPAAYDEVITVSALADFDGVPGGLGQPSCRLDQDDTLASFSNYGLDIDLIAPGVCIYSTYKDGGYKTLNGTSMAAPHVAGAAALYKARNPGSVPSTVARILREKGVLDWDANDDPDGTKETLLNVRLF